MRYSFHGKVRATGQQVDGYVEAETSTEAIDRLADQGIIGVYSVRAEPRQPRNPILLAGTPEFDRALYDHPESPKQKRRSLPAPPAPQQVLVPVPVAAPPPIPVPAAPPPPTVVAAAPGVSDAVMGQLVDKLATLIGQMQKFLERPAQVVYAAGGPAREGGRGGGKRAASKNVSDAQNSTLRDIFQNNLELRRSLQKLADTVTPAAPAVVAAAAEPALTEPALAEPIPAEIMVDPVATMGSAFDAVGASAETDHEPPPPPTGGGVLDTHVTSSDLDLTPSSDLSPEGSGDDLSMRVHDEDHARHAQPAA